MDEETIQQEQIKISVFTPIIYVGILLSAFITFSVIYRRRKINRLQKVESLFSDNHPAILYQFLKAQYNNPDAPKDSKPHEKVMKAALLRRGVEAIRRSLKLRENEPVITKLFQDGLVGENVFKQFELEGKKQELELKEVFAECESYKKGWVQSFFSVAQEICFNEALRRRLKAMDQREKTLCSLWEYYVDLSEKPSVEAPKPETQSQKKSGKKGQSQQKEDKKEKEKVEESVGAVTEKSNSADAVQSEESSESSEANAK